MRSTMAAHRRGLARRSRSTASLAERRPGPWRQRIGSGESTGPHDGACRPRRAANPEDERRLSAMTVDEVDAYLAGLEEPKRTTLEALRRSILAVVPDAEEGISYGMPAFRVDGKVVAGFAAFKNHLAYLPHSGEVLMVLGDRLAE